MTLQIIEWELYRQHIAHEIRHRPDCRAWPYLVRATACGTNTLDHLGWGETQDILFLAPNLESILPEVERRRAAQAHASVPACRQTQLAPAA